MPLRIVAAQALQDHRRAVVQMNYLDIMYTRAMAGDGRSAVIFTNAWRKAEANRNGR